MGVESVHKRKYMWCKYEVIQATHGLICLYTNFAALSPILQCRFTCSPFLILLLLFFLGRKFDFIVKLKNCKFLREKKNEINWANPFRESLKFSIIALLQSFFLFWFRIFIIKKGNKCSRLCICFTPFSIMNSGWYFFLLLNIFNKSRRTLLC